VGFRSVQLFFLVPLFLVSLFHLSLAELEVSAEGIRYRRLSGCGTVSFDEVENCGVSMVQMEIGFIRLKRFVSPWGKLYFILDDPYLKGMDIIGFIRERIDADKGVSREHAC
jgi:hypothetical protein